MTIDIQAVDNNIIQQCLKVKTMFTDAYSILDSIYKIKSIKIYLLN